MCLCPLKQAAANLLSAFSECFGGSLKPGHLSDEHARSCVCMCVSSHLLKKKMVPNFSVASSWVGSHTNWPRICLFHRSFCRSAFSSFSPCQSPIQWNTLKNSGSFELQKHGFLVEIYIGGCFLLAEHFIFHLTLFQTQTQMVWSRLQVRGQRLRLIYSLWFSVSSGHGHMALCWRGHRYQLTVMYVLCVCVCKSSGSTCVILSSRPVKERIGVYFCEWTSASWCCACEYILNEQCHAC